jgi:hypothetical protein
MNRDFVAAVLYGAVAGAAVAGIVFHSAHGLTDTSGGHGHAVAMQGAHKPVVGGDHGPENWPAPLTSDLWGYQIVATAMATASTIVSSQAPTRTDYGLV